MKDELIRSQETPEQRRQRIASRARELASRREADRQQLADELLQRAFEDNCEPLRGKLSQQVVYNTVAQRQAQVCFLITAVCPIACPFNQPSEPLLAPLCCADRGADVSEDSRGGGEADV